MTSCVLITTTNFRFFIRTGGGHCAEVGYELNDDGEDSPRGVGKVTEGTETASGGASGVDSEVIHPTPL